MLLEFKQEVCEVLAIQPFPHFLIQRGGRCCRDQLWTLGGQRGGHQPLVWFRDEIADASDKKEVTDRDPIGDDDFEEGELELANIDKVPVESNKKVENAKEAKTEVIAENTEDSPIDNSKPNIETSKENSKAGGRTK